MRSVSAAYSAALAESTVRLCEIYEVELASGSIYRYTNHDKDITWDAAGNTYKAIPGLKRGPIRYNSDGQYDECELTLGIQGAEFLAQVHGNILEAAKITHKRIRWDADYAADEEIILGVWIPDINYNRSTLQLRLLSELDSLNIKVPAHNYQEPCNNFLFDDTCGLTRADYAYSGTATDGSTTTLADTVAGNLFKVDFDGGDLDNPIERTDEITGGDNGYTAVVVQIVYLTESSGTIWFCELSNALNYNDDEVLSSGGDSVTVNGTPAEDTGFWQMGELEMITGDNSGEKRKILSSSGSTRTVFWPFASAVATGDTYKIYPGCDARPSTCHARFANKTNYRGFPFVPPLETTIM